ncbi:MAG: iron ABC transporter permease [Alphaproteobacteria bacterium]|nr:iron ABC transporter permease [Alphaproteobacteria bacterium]
MTDRRTLFGRPLLALLALALALPVLAVLGTWLRVDADAIHILIEMADTVLFDYVATSFWLCLGVGLGVVVLGTSTAALVTLFDFPLRRFWEWALLLPMAMPAYVLAYAYTDFLQFSGPLQMALRETFGWQGRLWPEVRSLGGAVLIFTLALYPYVYVLARASLAERAHPLMEAARMLGAPWGRRVWRVALPLARPAVAAGVALSLMEVLADFGVSSYFGIQTFTAGIYKAWLAMDHRVVAAQLATFLLVFVGLLLAWEKRAQSSQRYAQARPDRQGAEAQPRRLMGLQAGMACWVCAMPVLLGFALPVLILLHTLAASGADAPIDLGRFTHWAGNSLMLAGLTAVLATGVALALAAQERLVPSRWSRSMRGVVGLGYAMPGAVVVVGLLWPLGWLQAHWPQLGAGHWLTATVLGLVWAYLVRFVAVALQSVQSGYTRIPTAVDDSARMLGISGARLVSRVHAPLLRKPLAAAALLVFVDVMKELPVTLVLRPFNSDTLAVMAHQLARDERLGEAALPALALVLVGLLPVMMLSRALRQRPGP